MPLGEVIKHGSILVGYKRQRMKGQKQDSTFNILFRILNVAYIFVL